MRTLLPLFILLFTACDNSPPSKSDPIQGEYIYRLECEKRLSFDPVQPRVQKFYPWQSSQSINLLPISREYFRCKGSNLNQPLIIQEDGKETARYSDCGGAEKHSLPLRADKEYIYPILIELLNHIQERTTRPVIITSGHRCPTHNAYVDPSPANGASKHMTGAEVNFYVQGLEGRPEVIVRIIQEFYKTHPRYQNQKEYLEFQRFEKKSNVATLPWYNKELFIKVFKATEGRNFDNRHSHPYIALQVRFDYERNLRVDFSWDAAQAFLRK